MKYDAAAAAAAPEDQSEGSKKSPFSFPSHQRHSRERQKGTHRLAGWLDKLR